MVHKRISHVIESAVVEIKLRRYNKRFQQAEHFVGIRPEMQAYGRFLRGHESSNMSDKWQKAGLRISGNNYWTFGPPTNIGSSSRFDPTDDMYQAWFGAYTHVGIDGNSFGMGKDGPEIGLLKRLAEADQEFWLKAYGDNRPLARLTVFLEKGRLRIDGNEAWLYYGEIDSHSDVGYNGKGYAGAFGMARSRRLVSEVATDSSLFVPKPVLWVNHVAPHHRINLKGLFAVVPLGSATVCIYLNGAEYETDDKRHHDTWPILEKNAIEMIESVKIASSA